MADSQHDGVTQQGVGSGAFAIPDNLAEGRYTLVVRSIGKGFPEERQSFDVRRRPPPSKEESKPNSVNAGQIDVTFVSGRWRTSARPGEPRLLCRPQIRPENPFTFPG